MRGNFSFSHLLIISLLPALMACPTTPKKGNGTTGSTTSKSRYCSMNNPGVKHSLMNSISRLRSRQGLLDLAEDPRLSRSARLHAARLAREGVLEHGGGGGGLMQRLRKIGIRREFLGENIARLPYSSNPGVDVYQHWKTRRRELRNLLDNRYLRVGAAMVPGRDFCYSVLLLSN